MESLPAGISGIIYPRPGVNTFCSCFHYLCWWVLRKHIEFFWRRSTSGYFAYLPRAEQESGFRMSITDFMSNINLHSNKRVAGMIEYPYAKRGVNNECWAGSNRRNPITTDKLGQNSDKGHTQDVSRWISRVKYMATFILETTGWNAGRRAYIAIQCYQLYGMPSE